MKKQKMRKIVCFILTFVVLLSGMPKLQVNADSAPANVLLRESFEGNQGVGGICDLAGWVKVLGTATAEDAPNPVKSGSRSYYLNETKDMIRYDFVDESGKEDPQQGVVTLYMYDAMTTTPYVFADVAAYDVNTPAVPRNMALGVAPGKTNYVYADGATSNQSGYFKESPVTRTEGWHKLTWDYSDSGCKMYIDDIKVFDGATVVVLNKTYSVTSFDNIRIGSHWQGTSTGFCFDDITVVDKPVASVTVGNETVNQVSLQEAIVAVGNLTSNGEKATITLLQDIEYTDTLEIGDNITLDLNGKTLTASSVATFGGNVVDDSDDKTGLLKVDSTKCAFSPTNSQMPIYNGTDGYVFATITPQEKFSSEGENESTVYNLIFRPYFGSETTIQNAFTVNGTDDQFNVILRLTWTEDTEQKTQDLVYNDAMVQQVYDNNKAFYINASGVASFEGLTITPMVVSKDNGVAWSGTSFPEVTITE